MSQSVLSPRQFPTMSVPAVGKLEAGDYSGMTMGAAAADDYARWAVDDMSSRYGDGEAMEDLTNNVENFGVKEPLEISRNYRNPAGAPVVTNGHHRYMAAYDTGQSRVPVTGEVRAAKAYAHYTAP